MGCHGIGFVFPESDEIITSLKRYYEVYDEADAQNLQAVSNVARRFNLEFSPLLNRSSLQPELGRVLFASEDIEWAVGTGYVFSLHPALSRFIDGWEKFKEKWQKVDMAPCPSFDNEASLIGKFLAWSKTRTHERCLIIDRFGVHS